MSALKGFIACLGLPGSFLGFLQASLLMILLTKSPERPKASKKPPGSYKTFQGRNPDNIFVAVLVQTMKPKRNFEIN
jgi:hypothetical protein